MGWFLPLTVIFGGGSLVYANRGTVLKEFNEKAFVIGEDGERHFNFKGAIDGTIGVGKAIFGGVKKGGEKYADFLDDTKIVTTGKDHKGKDVPRWAPFLGMDNAENATTGDVLSHVASSFSGMAGKDVAANWNVSAPLKTAAGVGILSFLSSFVLKHDKVNLKLATLVTAAAFVFFNIGKIKNEVKGFGKTFSGDGQILAGRTDEEYNREFDLDSLEHG